MTYEVPNQFAMDGSGTLRIIQNESDKIVSRGVTVEGELELRKTSLEA